MNNRTTFRAILLAVGLAVSFSGEVVAAPRDECNYNLLPELRNRERLGGGCRDSFQAGVLALYPIETADWDDGWGYVEAFQSGLPSDPEWYFDLPFCRLMNGIRMLEDSGLGLPPASLLVTSPHYVRREAKRLYSGCPQPSGVRGYANAAWTDNDPVEGVINVLGGPIGSAVTGIVGTTRARSTYINVDTLYTSSPILVAGLLLHETRHHDGGPNDSTWIHSTNDCPAGRIRNRPNAVTDEKFCDFDVADGGAWSVHAAYLEEFAHQTPSVPESGVRPRVLFSDLSAAVTEVNRILSLYFQVEPGYRLDDPSFSVLNESLPRVGVQQLAVGCSTDRCTWRDVSTAESGIDSCWLTRFGGRFERDLGGAADELWLDSSESFVRLRTRSHLDSAEGASSPYWPAVPFGGAECRSGGRPTRYEFELTPGGSNALDARLENPLDFSIAQSLDRVCYITGVRGDLDAGDYVSVGRGAIDGHWHATLFSNFTTGSPLKVQVGCSSGSIKETFSSYSSQSTPLIDAGFSCALTEVRSDFAGRDEWLAFFNDFGQWTFRFNSNRPFDPGANIGGRGVCFTHLN